MSEPVIVGYGRQFVSEYPVEELRASLVLAFRDCRADFITLDDNPRNQRFLAASAAWAIDQGLLYNNRSSDDGQQVVSSFRLTKKGKQDILSPA